MNALAYRLNQRVNRNFPTATVIRQLWGVEGRRDVGCLIDELIHIAVRDVEVAPMTDYR